MKAQLLIDCKNHLGEGILWSESQNTLYWLDIPMPSKLFQLKLDSNELEVFDMPEMISSMSIRPNGDMLVASHHGINNFDIKNNKFTRLINLESDLPKNRCNDGATDAKGRFWIGTMQNNISEKSTEIKITENLGNLYSINHDFTFKKWESNIAVSNSISWSPDNKKFYFTDTFSHTIFSYDFDLENGSISNKKEFAKYDSGFPDGATVDVEGGLWSCRWGGSSVVRFNSKGQIDCIIEIPDKNVTNCTFGGKNLDTLFITTARWGMTEDELKINPNAGALYSIKPGFKGIADNQFGG
tara:strand:- start:119 stop:1012 length:894 start_codon:yes stop_codon:yes gene_type:complete